MVDHYAILGIAPDCEPDEIKSAYRALVQIHHPDRHPDQSAEAHERFLAIKAAYDLLSDPEQRMAYDAELVVAFADRYEYEEDAADEDAYVPNPPARMPVVHDDGSDGLLRMLLVVILPIVASVVAALAFESLWAVILTALGALLAAVWIGSLLGSNAE